MKGETLFIFPQLQRFADGQVIAVVLRENLTAGEILRDGLGEGSLLDNVAAAVHVAEHGRIPGELAGTLVCAFQHK